MGSRSGEIVEAALVVVARDGLGGLTMRAVAAEVGVTPMALYRHVSDKEALLDAMVGRMLSEVPTPREGSWIDQLEHVARHMLALARRYPTALPLLLTRPYVAPEAVQLVAVLYDLFARAGAEPESIPRLERMFSTFVLGYVISAANDAFWAEERVPTGAIGSEGAERSDRWALELAQDVHDFAAMIAERPQTDAVRERQSNQAK